MNAFRRRLLWWRYAWPFRFAHKPLCERFHGDVLKLGRLHLCRGCTFLYTGAIATGALLAFGLPEVAAIAVIFYALVAVVALGSHPALYGRWTRGIRDGLRFGAGATVSLALAFFALGALWLGAVHVAVLGAVYAAYAQKRAGLKAGACAGCPELGNGVCSGYRLQAEAVRAHEERLTRELMERGFVPDLARKGVR